MDADRFWGWGRLFGPVTNPETGEVEIKFRWKRTLVNGGLHLLMALGVAAAVTTPIAHYAGLGFGASCGMGTGIGVFAVALREGIQWAVSSSPHLVDRALDILPSPIGGLAGGALAWWLDSLW